MNGAHSTGLLYSALLHLAVLAFAIWGLPELFDRRPPPEPQAITVELLPISAVSNVKNAPRPKPKKPKVQKKESKPQPPVKKADEKPVAPPPAEKKEDKKKKAEVKKKDKKKKPKKKPKEEDLAAVLKAVKDTAQKQKDKQKDDGGSKSKSDQYDPTLPLSMSELDAIKSQFIQCWSIPAGAKNAHELVVTLRVELDPTGAVLSVKLAGASKSRYASDSFFRAAADSAMRAVHVCSPLKNLPADKYSTWRSMELNFDPKDLLY